MSDQYEFSIPRRARPDAEKFFADADMAPELKPPHKGRVRLVFDSEGSAVLAKMHLEQVEAEWRQQRGRL